MFAGKIGQKGGARRATIPDTIPLNGEPIVFDQGATLIVPSYKDMLVGGGAGVSLWSLPFFGFDLPGMQLWRVHGDSLKPLMPLRGTASVANHSAGWLRVRCTA